MEIQDITAQLVHWSMRLAQAQMETAASNVASANVTGYRPQRVDFSNQLAALNSANGDANALAATLAQPEFHRFTLVTESSEGPFGASVRLDHEIAQMTTANTRYMSLVDGLNRHFGLMRLAVTGRS